MIAILIVLGYAIFGLAAVGIIIFMVVKRIKDRGEETFEDRDN